MDLATIARTAVHEHRASQNAEELADALELVAATVAGSVGVVVEIGCDRGGTLYAWRQVCDRVYGITLADNSYATGGGGLDLIDHGAVVRIGDSHDPESRWWLADQLNADVVGDLIDVLVIDGDHSVQGVFQDLADYQRFVRPGGITLLHDIHSKGDARCDVWKAWPEIREMYRTEEIGNVHGWGVIFNDIGGAR